ncbi:hypothetical protein [Rhizobium ecuadorense]|uniref:hypothetical protein n=1 Tax=Rhizobium ecuadorense TaxID=1671795 RepID=UPI0006734B55|nr:hypothetical protein [Rhizobium ecuadorense]
MASDEHQLERALHILHNMALERTGPVSFFNRWYISDEPLRNDAANLLREIGYHAARPTGTRLVGDDTAIRALKSDAAPAPEPKPFTFADPAAQLQHERLRARKAGDT